ncbi:MAG: RecX family transcriptional regulator [Acidobacteriota bacterium]
MEPTDLEAREREERDGARGALVRARRAARVLLARRPRTVQELRRALKRHEPGAVERVIGELVAAGSLDDRRTGMEWLRYVRECRPMGRLRLRAELRKRGLEREQIEALLVEYYQAATEAEDLQRALDRLRARGGGAGDPAALRRLAARLGRRGFAAADVLAALEGFTETDG